MNRAAGAPALDPETQKHQPQVDKIEAAILVVDAPFSVDGHATLFGQRWGGECITLSAEHLAAWQSGMTSALDVQNGYETFVRLEASRQGGGSGCRDSGEARGLGL